MSNLICSRENMRVDIYLGISSLSRECDLATANREAYPDGVFASLSNAWKIRHPRSRQTVSPVVFHMR